MVSATSETFTRPHTMNILSGNFDTITTTGNAYVVQGISETRSYTKKRFLFSSTTNALTVKLSGYLSHILPSLSITIGEFTLTPGVNHAVLIETMYDEVQVSVKPAVGGAHGTLNTYFIFDNTEHVPVRNSFASESLTITNAAVVGFTRATMDSALDIMVTVESNPVRFWTDGTDPTTTTGHLVSAGDSIHLTSMIDALNFKCIATGANATLRVTYSR